MKKDSFQDDEVTQPPHRGEVGRRLPQQLSLVIYHRGEAEIVPLIPHARIVIGRANEADISIPEPTLSRQHCRIEVVGGDVWLEDLDSTDGSWVNGKPAIRCRLRPGDDVTLGMVTLSLHTTSHYTRGIEHHARFVSALEEEVTRSRTFGHQLALILLVPARDSEQQAFSSWCPSVRQLLRPVDRIALSNCGALQVLLPEAGLTLAKQLVERIKVAAPALRTVIAIYPGAGDTAGELLERCQAVLEGPETATDPLVVGPGEAPPDSAQLGIEAIWGESMRSVLETVRRVARSDLPVLILGETGTGKELIAHAIHEAGPRRDRQMRSCNCGAIPRELVQSTLFGHERGSFTGASQQQRGVFETADRSTLLLDEVGELPHEAQVALLRVLETGRLVRVGSSRELPVDVRVLSATHANLEAMCEVGSFRWDLYYRLNTITLKVPPLRQRVDEIEPMVKHFVDRACKLSELKPKAIDKSVIDVLKRYQWRGNVRELRNAVERAVLVCTGPVLHVVDLPEQIQSAVQPSRSDGTRSCRPMVENAAGGFKNRVRCFEVRLIRRALERTDWNKTAAAQQLQMPLRTLMHKIQVFGLTRQVAGDDDTQPVLEAITDDDSSPRAFKTRIREYETKLLVEALDQARWNKAEAARRLRLPLSTMLYKIKAYELESVN